MKYPQILYFLLVFLLTSCGKKETNQDITPIPGVTVMDITGDRTSGDTMRKYIGTIEEESETSASFSLAGTVESIKVKEGQHVTRGTLIATMDPRSASESYKLANATLERAQDAYTRVKLMYDSASVPEIKLVEASTAVKQAKASAEIAKKNLDDTRLLAPESGVIGKKSVQVGENVAPGQTIVTILNTHNLEAAFSVPEGEMASLRNGQIVRINIPVLDNAVIKGTITQKGVEGSPGTHTYVVKARLASTSPDILPGMLCDVAIESQGAEVTGVELPIHAIHAGIDGKKYVWIVKDNKSYLSPVTTGDLTPSGVKIISGLHAGDKVIVDGMNKVSEGKEVKIL